jgi:MTH538 TIR-like domain (DUF1863)
MGSPFDPYDGKSLLSLLSETHPPPPKPSLSGLSSALSPFGSFSPLSGKASVFDLINTPPPPAPPLPVKPAVALAPPMINRKVYFAFDFDDLIRVNNVRQVGKVGPREQKGPRQFSDRSIWESRDIKNEQNLKNLMLRAVRFSSAVCVLVGSKTYQSRWVKYEIARAIIDQRGLMAVHLNSINHHQRKAPDRLGVNPLHVMGVYRHSNGNFYLYEKHVTVVDAANSKLDFAWRPYDDYTDPVPFPRYLQMPSVDRIMPLAINAKEYDMTSDQGFKNIGSWIDAAAVQVGR